MTAAPQSSPGYGLLPACVLVLSLLAPALCAQTPATIRTAGSFFRNPNNTQLGTITAGTRVTAGAARGGWTEVTLEAWIWTESTDRTDRDGFDIIVTARPAENLRVTPGGAVVGRGLFGVLFNRVSAQGGWTRIRRNVWVSSGMVAPSTLAAAPPPPPPATTAGAPDTTGALGSGMGSERVGLRDGTTLTEAPDGPAVATLVGPGQARVLEQSAGGDWVRVSLDGWVRRSAITERMVDSSGITLADLQAAPDRYTGRTVVWRLQFLALQTADALRPEMPTGQPYLLTRGPLPESGFVYLMVPSADAARLRTLAPLTELVVEATIRAARTRYLPNPVLELVRIRSGG